MRDFVCGERAEEEEFRRGGGEVQAKVVNEVDAEGRAGRAFFRCSLHQVTFWI